MKIMIVGLGSMGKRRLRLCKTIAGELGGSYVFAGVDSRTDRQAEAELKFGCKTYSSLDEAIERFSPDAAFVCTSPLSHASIIKTLLTANISVFTEINLVSDGYEENVSLADEKGLTLFLSSTQLYRRELMYITSKTRSAACPLRYRYHVGQYLPDWHPWEKYTDFFLGDSRTNGIREILAIELPWLEKAFSKATGYTSVFNKITNLTTTYPDCLMLTLTHENGTVGQLMIDVVSRKAVRDFEVVGEDLYIHWGGTPASLTEHNTVTNKDISVETYQDVVNDPRYAENIIENAYVDEIKAFFKVLSGRNNVTRHTFTDDKRILDLIDSIEGRSTS